VAFRGPTSTGWNPMSSASANTTCLAAEPAQRLLHRSPGHRQDHDLGVGGGLGVGRAFRTGRRRGPAGAVGVPGAHGDLVLLGASAVANPRPIRPVPMTATFTASPSPAPRRAQSIARDHAAVRAAHLLTRWSARPAPSGGRRQPGRVRG
jgi:hypothetical protein